VLNTSGWQTLKLKDKETGRRAGGPAGRRAGRYAASAILSYII